MSTITTTLTAVTEPIKATTVDASSPTSISAYVASQEAHDADISDNFVPELNLIIGQTNTVIGELNTLASGVSTNAGIATTKAGEALASANAALVSQNAAAASAITCADFAGAFVSTSTTSVLISTGSKSFTTQTGEQYSVGAFISIAYTTTPTNFMHGQVTSYNSGTGALVVDVQSIGGSGTYALWSISLSGARGATGAAGATTTINNTLTSTSTTEALSANMGKTLKDTKFAIAGGNLTGAINNTQIDKGTVSSGTVTFTQSAGNVQRLQVGGALTIATNGWATSGVDSFLKIALVNGGSATITLPTISWIKPDGTKTTSFSEYLTAIKRTGFQASGTDFIGLWSSDAGTTIYGKLA